MGYFSILIKYLIQSQSWPHASAIIIEANLINDL